MRVNNAHAKQSRQQTEPAILGAPTSLKIQQVLSLLVVLVDQWQAVTEKVRNLRAVDFSVINVSKVVFKRRSMLDVVRFSGATGRDLV
jgi:hypothetical protein